MFRQTLAFEIVQVLLYSRHLQTDPPAGVPRVGPDGQEGGDGRGRGQFSTVHCTLYSAED